jgi:hypothetical protein
MSLVIVGRRFQGEVVGFLMVTVFEVRLRTLVSKATVSMELAGVAIPLPTAVTVKGVSWSLENSLKVAL